MRLPIKKNLPWLILLLVFLLFCVYGVIMFVTMFTPSRHNYSVHQVKEETTEEESQKEGTYYAYGGAHGLPMCSEPSKYSKVVTVIPNKMPVEIVSSLKRGYYKVRYGDKEGYVKSRYLLTVDQKASKKVKKKLKEEYPLYYVVNCDESVNLYKKRKETSKVKAQVPKGYSVRVLSTVEKGYYRVAYKNKIGYISAENLTKYQ